MSFKSYLGQSALPRGLENNNPGNLVLTSINWQGKIPNAQNTDGHFEQFTQLRWGLRAMIRDIMNDISEGTNTLRSLINEYAPPHENDTENYINFVSNLTGILPSERLLLNKTVITALVKAKVAMENGSAYSGYVTDKDINDAYAILGKPLADGPLNVEQKKK